MKNILRSRIVVSGAASHWDGDVNGEVVKPEIIISGSDSNGYYGRVRALVERSTTSGASIILWQMSIGFGMFEKDFSDVVLFNGENGELYPDSGSFDKESRDRVSPLTGGVYIARPKIDPNVWEILGRSNQKINGAGKKFFGPHGWGASYPSIYHCRFRNMPTLGDIDSRWEAIVGVNAKYLEVQNDQLMVVLGKASMPFSSL